MSSSLVATPRLAKLYSFRTRWRLYCRLFTNSNPYSLSMALNSSYSCFRYSYSMLTLCRNASGDSRSDLLSASTM